MEVTNGDIYACKEPLQRLIDRDDLSIKYAIEIVRLARKLSSEIVILEEQRNTLIKKYGADKDGQVTVEQGTEGFASFVVDFNELMSLQTEIDVKKVLIPDSIKISTRDLVALEPFLQIVEDA